MVTATVGGGPLLAPRGKYDYNGSFIAAFDRPTGAARAFITPIDIAATTRNGNV